MNERIFDELINRINIMEQQIADQKKAFSEYRTITEDIILELVSRHTHFMNGKVHWNLPQQIVERRFKEAQIQFERNQKQKNNKREVRSQKERANADDSFSFELTELVDKGR